MQKQTKIRAGYQIDPLQRDAYMRMLQLKRDLADAIEDCEEIDSSDAIQIIASQIRTLYLGVEEFGGYQFKDIAEIMRDIEQRLLRLPE